MSVRHPASEPRQVVVTGVGVVGPCGDGVEALAAALAAGQPCASPIDRLEGVPAEADSARTAGLVTGRDFEAWLSRRTSRRMSPPSIFAVVAARMALADAGLVAAGAVREEIDPDCAVLLSTSFGATSFTQRMLDQILGDGPESISPFLFMESVANAPAGQVAIHCRAGGPNHTLCQREAGTLSAVARGAAEVGLGRAHRALVGSSEEMTPLLHTVLDRFGAAADRPRPLDRRRDGFLPSEGAAVLLLESAEEADLRGLTPRAQVVAWGGTFDPTAPVSDWGSGEGAPAVAATLRRGLERAGIDLGQDRGGIDVVVSGASGARRGDRLEAAVLSQLFAEGLPPVLVPKAVTGEYGGGHLVAGLLALEGCHIAAPEGFQPDPEVGLAPHHGPLPEVPRRVLLTSQAAGGAGSWVILDRPAPR